VSGWEKKMRLNKYLNSIGREKFKDAIENNKRLSSFKVKFKLTKRCNLKCKKCNYWKIKNCGEELDLEKIKKTLDEISLGGCTHIKFSGGEVLLRTDIMEIIKYAKEKDIEVSITTNGTLIDKKKAEDLIDSGIDQINISIDSPNKEDHENTTQIPGSYERTLRAFSNINEVCKNKNKKISLVLQCVVFKGNYKNISEIVRLAEKIGVEKISFLNYNSAHLQEKELDMGKEEINEFNNHIFPSVQRLADSFGIKIINPAYFAYSEIDRENYYSKHICYIPWINYYINPGGKVYACCTAKGEEFLLGSIKEEALSDILNSDKYSTFREKSKSPILRFSCRGCLNELNTNLQIKKWL
jgi:Fe-coproporphyrin III synthase